MFELSHFATVQVCVLFVGENLEEQIHLIIQWSLEQYSQLRIYSTVCLPRESQQQLYQQYNTIYD